VLHNLRLISILKLSCFLNITFSELIHKPIANRLLFIIYISQVIATSFYFSKLSLPNTYMVHFILILFGRPFVKLFALCYQTVVCLSCLSVMYILSVWNVGVLWPNGWMDQDETWHVGRVALGLAIMREMGNQLPLPKRGTAPIFGPCLLWPNSWMDQDATWHGDRPRPRPHCVRWGPSSSPPKKR